MTETNIIRGGNSVSELYHYGVKGMKWGVRRDIGTKARAAGVYGRDINIINRRVNRLQKKRAKKGLTAGQTNRLVNYKNATKAMTIKRDTLIKDLSPKDIRRGQNAITARHLILKPRYANFLDAGDVSRASKIAART